MAMIPSQIIYGVYQKLSLAPHQSSNGGNNISRAVMTTITVISVGRDSVLYGCIELVSNVTKRNTAHVTNGDAEVNG